MRLHLRALLLLLLCGAVACEGDKAARESLPASRTSGAPASAEQDSTSAELRAAIAVVDAYYAAIDARQFRRAFEMWADDGRASGQSFAEFTRGFSETERVRVHIREPVQLEGAAGSRYVTVPVQIHALRATGEEQEFSGHYVLRRGVAPGASEQVQRWQINSASISRQVTGATSPDS